MGVTEGRNMVAVMVVMVAVVAVKKGVGVAVEGVPAMKGGRAAAAVVMEATVMAGWKVGTG